MSNSLWPHELQHARLPCLSLSPGVCSNSCPLSQWCRPTISHPMFFLFLPAFNLSKHQSLFQWVSFSHRVAKNIGALNSASTIQGWFPLGWTGFISLQSQGLSRVFSSTTVQKHPFFSAQLSLYSNSHMTTRKTIALTRCTFVGKVMSLLFNMLSRFVILSDFTFTFYFHALEKEMVTHSSVLAWRIPGMGEPDWLPSMGSHRVGHDWSDLAAATAGLS